MSPSQDPTLHSLTSHIAWHLQRGATPREAELQARTFLPGMADDLYRTALREAQYGVATAERANQLGQDRPLSDALLGLPQPGETVTVRVLLDVVLPSGEETQRSVRVNVPWSTTRGEVMEAAFDTYESMDDHYAQNQIADATIMGPLRFRDR